MNNFTHNDKYFNKSLFDCLILAENITPSTSNSDKPFLDNRLIRVTERAKLSSGDLVKDVKGNYYGACKQGEEKGFILFQLFAFPNQVRWEGLGVDEIDPITQLVIRQTTLQPIDIWTQKSVETPYKEVGATQLPSVNYLTVSAVKVGDRLDGMLVREVIGNNGIYRVKCSG